MTGARGWILALLRIVAIFGGFALFMDAFSRMPDPVQGSKFVLENEIIMGNHNADYSSSTSWLGFMRVQEYVLRSMAGAVMMLAAILLWVPRFSLKRLLVVVLCAGFAVALPLMIRPYPVRHLALINVCFDQDFFKPPLSDGEMSSISAALQPSQAKTTLPAGFLQALSGRFEDVKVAVSSTRTEKDGRTYAGLSCELQIPVALDGQAAHGIFDFYTQYALRLAEARINTRGHALKSHPSPTHVLWSRWEPEWQREYERSHPTGKTPGE